MSLSIALSIMTPPSGLAPSGGEAVSGDDGVFAGLVEAEVGGTDTSTGGKATVPSRPVEVGSPSSPADDLEILAVGTDGTPPAPQPIPIVPQPVVPLAPPTVDANPVDVPSSAFAAPSIATATETVVADVPPTPSAASSPKASGPSGLSGPVIGTDTGPQPDMPVEATRTVDRSKPVEVASPPTAPVPAAGQPATQRAAIDARPVARPRDVAANRAPAAGSEASATTDGEATSDAPVDPAIAKASRVPNAPVPVAPPPVAPALVTALQGSGNAAAASPETATPDAAPAPGSDRPATVVPTAAATAMPASPETARSSVEIAPPVVAESDAVADPVLTEGRVEAAPEAAPATPAAANASSLSRASIETTALLAAQIARRLEGRSTRFDMALTPEGLGRVDVRVEIDGDGQLAARLAFDNPAAATELRGRADELRRQLEDAGFTLSRDALDFSEREPSSGGQGAFERQQRRAAYAHRIPTEPDLTPLPAAWSHSNPAPRGVDMKV